MQQIQITGRIGQDAEIRTAGSSEVTSFNVAVDQGFGDKKLTNWFRVSIWGERGRKLAGHILKGNKIAVAGDLEIGEYNGKPQYNIRANDVDPWMSNGTSPRQSDGAGSSERPAPDGRQGSPAPSRNAQAFDSDLDDDVPFLSADPVMEGRVG